MSDKVLENWDLAAIEYSKSQENSIYAQFNKDFIEYLFQNVTELNILDVGCGDGYYTNYFRNKGSTIIGCDGSTAMINIAKLKYPLCKFEIVDLKDAMPYENNQFDLVFCNMVLMDNEPIDILIKEANRVLNQNGKLFISIVHPAFYLADWERNNQGQAISKKVKSYISPLKLEQNFWSITTHYHRPLSFYFNKISNYGFALKKMHEPKVYEANKIPDIPLYLFAEFNKQINM